MSKKNKKKAELAKKADEALDWKDQLARALPETLLTESGLASNELREASEKIRGVNVALPGDALIPADADAIVTPASLAHATTGTKLSKEETERQKLRSSEAAKLQLAAYGGVRSELTGQFEQFERTIKAKDAEIERLNSILSKQSVEIKKLSEQLAAVQRGEVIEPPEGVQEPPSRVRRND